MFKHLEAILKNIKLGKKFTILLLVVFVWGIVFSGIALTSLLERNAENEISSKAYMLMGTLTSVRNYTQKAILPELIDKLETEFLPQVVSAYAAREVFEGLRENEDYREFFYKEAVLNPTNLRDKADTFEAAMTNRFRQETHLKELTGFRSFPNEDFFYIARPIKVLQPSCLQCHSTPDAAPKTMIERYGTANGFGWPLNQVIGVQMISVPARAVLQQARKSLILIMAIVIGVFAAVIFMVNYCLKRYVIGPLNRMTHVAEAVSTGDIDVEFEQMSKDEVGRLAAAFTRMKTSLAIAMKRLERYSTNRYNSININETGIEDTDQNNS